jgi:hypothetical protein
MHRYKNMIGGIAWDGGVSYWERWTHKRRHGPESIRVVAFSFASIQVGRVLATLQSIVQTVIPIRLIVLGE